MSDLIAGLLKVKARINTEAFYGDTSEEFQSLATEEISSLDAAIAALTQAQADRIEQERQYNLILKHGSYLDGEVTRLQAEIAGLQIELTKANELSQRRWESVCSLDAKKDELFDKVRVLQNLHTANCETITTVRAENETLKKRVLTFAEWSRSLLPAEDKDHG